MLNGRQFVICLLVVATFWPTVYIANAV